MARETLKNIEVTTFKCFEQKEKPLKTMKQRQQALLNEENQWLKIS